MSHFLTIKTEILDLEMLKKTISELGFAMEEKVKITESHGRREAVDFAVRIDVGSYLGFKKEGKGYTIICAPEILHQERNRRFVGMIQQEYAYRKVLHETRKRGFSLVQEERVKAGVIKLILKKVA